MTARNLIALTGLALAGVLLAGQVRQLLADPKVWPPDDFVEYWAAAKLTLEGQNPFDAKLLLPLQQHAGRDTDEAIMMWNPPWSLPAVLPLGVLPAREAQLLWLLVHLVVTGFCGDRLWLLFGGGREYRWVGWLVAFLFMPSVFALSSGQISMFLLLGVALFLECERRDWQYLAGAATVLVAIKPHLAYLLWVGIGVDAVVRGRWRVVVGGAAVGVVCSLLPMAFNPQVWHQYADAMGNRPPAHWLTPTLGTLLRLMFGEQRFGLQFVPVAVGLAWFAWYRWKRRDNWNWTEQLPLLLFVSFMTAPYGAWPFDMVLLLPGVYLLLTKSLAAWKVDESISLGSPRFTVAALIAVNVGCLVMNLFQTGSFWFIWVSPVVLLLYALHKQYIQRTKAGLPPRVLTVGPGAVAFLIVWLLLVSGGRSAFFKDPGTFWHTTTGELILKDGFIRADPYTFTFAGQWWVPYQWLGEVGMAIAHRVCGFDTQLLGAVTLIAAVFAWLAVRLLRTGLHPIVAGSVIALSLAAAASHFHVRPHLFTLAGMALVAVALVEADVARPRLKRLFWLIPFCVIWTSVHGGVLGGIGTLGIALAGWVVFWRLGRPSPVRSWRDFGLLVLVAAGCGLSMFANPYGTDLVKTWRVIMDAPELRTIIAEHRPLDVTEPYAWPVLALAAVYGFVLYGVKRSAVRVSWLLPLVWLLLAFSRVRHAPLFAVVAVVSITAMWKHTRWALWLAAYRPDLYQPGSTVTRPWWSHVWLPAVAVLLAFVLQATRTPVPVIGSGWATHDARYWPVDVLDVLKEHDPKAGEPNRLFNGGYIDGGFVIYHAPGYKVFVDDRCELFGGPWLLDFVHKSFQPGNAIDEWEAKYGKFDYALTRTGTPFDDWFAASGVWQAVKVSPVATFYKRKRV